MPVRGQQDVGRLDVAVQHTGAVGGLDGAADLDRDAEHFGHRDPLAAIPLAERGGAELHDQIRPTVGRDARLIDREDRRVRGQRCHQVGFRLEHLADLVVDHFAEHHFDRDLASRHVLLVQEHVGEAPGTEHVNVRETRQDRGLRG